MAGVKEGGYKDAVQDVKRVTGKEQAGRDTGRLSNLLIPQQNSRRKFYCRLDHAGKKHKH